MPLLLDTGFIYALADRSDSWHRRCKDFLAQVREPLLVPAPVLPEVCYLLHERLSEDAERAFVLSLAKGELGVEALVRGDYARCAAILARHGAIGFVDASVIAVAERLRLRRIATTDRRDFPAIRPAHVARFELVP